MVGSPRSPEEEEPPPPPPPPPSAPTPPPPSASEIARMSNLTSLGAARGGGSLRPGAALASGSSSGASRAATFHAAVISFTTAAAAAAAAAGGARGSRADGGGGPAGAERAASGGGGGGSGSSSGGSSSSLPGPAAGAGAAAGAKRLPLEPWAAVAAQALVLLLIFLLSSLGNCAVMGVIVKHRQLRTVTNAFVLSLSLSDLLTALLCLPAAFLALFARPGGGPGPGPGGPGGGGDGPPAGAPWQRFCAASRFFGSCFGIVSTLTVTLISLDRYNAIVRRPGEKMGRRTALGLVLAVWLAAAGLSCPWELLRGPEAAAGEGAPGRAAPSFQRCLALAAAGPSRRSPAYNVWLILTCYLVPFGVMCFCLCRICRAVRCSDVRVRPATPYGRLLRVYRDVRTATTVLLMIVFVVFCWGPYCLLVLFSAAAGAAGARAPPLPPGLHTAATWMAWANGAINPLIYAIRNPNISVLLRHKREEGYRTGPAAPSAAGPRPRPPAGSGPERPRGRRARRLGACGRASSGGSAAGGAGGELALWACRNPALLFCRDAPPRAASAAAVRARTADTSL